VSHVVIDDLTEPFAWETHTPDGDASDALLVEPGLASRLGGPTLAIRAVAPAEGHLAERSVGAVDLAGHEDLQLWAYGDRVAEGTEASPFLLELRLGSTSLSVGAAGNDWHRLVPLNQVGVWQPIPLALDDLPAAVRSGVSEIRLTCVGASAPFVVQLDAILAVHEEVLNDVDAALADRIGGRVEIRGALVAAVVEPDTAPDPPFLSIRNYEVRPAPERSPSNGLRTDYTEHGFAIRPPSVPVDVFYAIKAVAEDRSEAARLLEFLLAELTPVSTLEVGGRPLTVEWVGPPPLEGELPAQPAVHVRVSTSQRPRAVAEAAVRPFNRIDVEVDSRASS
jgi:hypothetical protein